MSVEGWFREGWSSRQKESERKQGSQGETNEFAC